jgi:hypothetical protein
MDGIYRTRTVGTRGYGSRIPTQYRDAVKESYSRVPRLNVRYERAGTRLARVAAQWLARTQCRGFRTWFRSESWEGDSSTVSSSDHTVMSQ